jgi:uncharacterized protein YbcI
VVRLGRKTRVGRVKESVEVMMRQERSLMEKQIRKERRDLLIHRIGLQVLSLTSGRMTGGSLRSIQSVPDRNK